MATFKAYANGASMGCPGNGGARPNKRGPVNGWSAASVRRHVRWLWSVDVPSLTGDGFGVTLTVRNTPADHGDWKQVREIYLRRLREAGLLRWHWLTEWQRRGTPHLHMAVYVPEGWVPPGSPIRDIMSTTGSRDPAREQAYRTPRCPVAAEDCCAIADVGDVDLRSGSTHRRDGPVLKTREPPDCASNRRVLSDRH